MAKKITIKIKNAKVQKRRSPHKPTKAHSTKKGKKGYSRKYTKKDLENL